MLVPAILYKDQIESEMTKLFYTEDMFLETGSMDNYIPKIEFECPADKVQYAIINDNGELIGHLAYSINWYSSQANGFALISFDKGNTLLAHDLFMEMEKLLKRFHRIEYMMVGGNPVERSYDKFCTKHNGTKHIMKDSLKDKDGSYHDLIVYEIITSNK